MAFDQPLALAGHRRRTRADDGVEFAVRAFAESIRLGKVGGMNLHFLNGVSLAVSLLAVAHSALRLIELSSPIDRDLGEADGVLASCVLRGNREDMRPCGSGGRETRLSAQLIGSAGLTGTAAAAYYVAAGRFDSTAFALWGANWLFAANQIQFVQARIQAGQRPTRREKLAAGRGLMLGQILSVLVLGFGWKLGWLPGLVFAAFVPAFFRGFAWCLSSRPSLLEIHRLGVSELAQAVAFGALLILGFAIGNRY